MAPPRSDHRDEAYPSELRNAEQALLDARRTAAGFQPGRPEVGVALSGGGIRSATFCLGLFQALAERNLVRRIDFLSTVSGGGYFGSFLGAAFCRDGAKAETVEADLADNHSWPVEWLRQNGRFLSPNGAGDSWLSAAVLLRNWIALHVVLLTFGFLLLVLGVLVRAELWTLFPHLWSPVEHGLWDHPVMSIWWSPWLVLPVFPFVLLMVPTGSVYWLTQFGPLMGAVRRLVGLGSPRTRAMTNHEFAAVAQNTLTHAFTFGFILTVSLLIFAVVDSLGQTIYLQWADSDFKFPSLWAMLTGAGAGAYSFGSQIYVFIEKLLGKQKFKITFNAIALLLAIFWLLLIVVALSVVACGFAWNWLAVWDGTNLRPMLGGWPLSVVAWIAFGLSWWFSRCFSFVNLASLQQLYAARLRRAYVGATNPFRREQQNFSMTDLLPGDDLCLEHYQPHARGGPLHFINVTVNETVSGKTQIERFDRKGLIMALGPAGVSVGSNDHARWVDDDTQPAAQESPFAALSEDRFRKVLPIMHADTTTFHALRAQRQLKSDPPGDPNPAHKIEALSLGRWVAISGAAFSTGLGAGTQLGLCLLLGLANVRLGYWWNCGIGTRQRNPIPRPTFAELAGRVLSRVLPVQMCLVNELFARFHGPSRRHWYLSDGGHFENTGCYELIRRRVPFIVCSDAGQDAIYEFADLANLIRKARTDFGAEIELIRHGKDADKAEPVTPHPLPTLEEFVHPELLELFGAPEDFPALVEDETQDNDASPASRPPSWARAHAILARIRYTDTGEICWLMVVKPSLMGDEPIDVVEYQRTHALFPQEPTSDQYFDEAQWESYRKLGEHIGRTLFTPPNQPSDKWSPSLFRAPV